MCSFVVIIPQSIYTSLSFSLSFSPPHVLPLLLPLARALSSLSLSCARVPLRRCPPLAHARSSPLAASLSLSAQWEQLGQKKVCVNCPTGVEMEEIEKRAVAKGLVTYFVTDAGRTQIPAGSRTV